MYLGNGKMIKQGGRLEYFGLSGTGERYAKMFKCLFLKALFGIHISKGFVKHNKIEILRLKEEGRD